MAGPGNGDCGRPGAIALSTVVVGNRAECAMATGSDDPGSAADALLDAGVTIAVVKLGGGGVLATAAGRFRIEPIPVPVVCGLGAGDAFGGALVHGLLSGWDLARVGRYANAAGAFAVRHLTCADGMPSVAEVDAMLANTDPRGAHVLTVLTRPHYAELIEARVRAPASLRTALLGGRRRSIPGDDGRLVILAADHTARGIVAAGGDPRRRRIASRCSTGWCASLALPGVDGVLASADILEELAWLGALEATLAIATMRSRRHPRRPLGADDRITAYDVARRRGVRA